VHLVRKVLGVDSGRKCEEQMEHSRDPSLSAGADTVDEMEQDSVNREFQWMSKK
jgi:hypothetical protein